MEGLCGTTGRSSRKAAGRSPEEEACDAELLLLLFLLPLTRVSLSPSSEEKALLRLLLSASLEEAEEEEEVLSITPENADGRFLRPRTSR